MMVLQIFLWVDRHGPIPLALLSPLEEERMHGFAEWNPQDGLKELSNKGDCQTLLKSISLAHRGLSESAT